MRSGTTSEKIIYWLFADRTPATKLIAVANVLTFFLVIFRLGGFLSLAVFDTATFLAMPWSAVTYPLIWAVPDPISLLFAGWWMLWAGGSLERGWGTRKFCFFFFGMSAITALSLFTGATLLGTHLTLAGLWLPIAGITVAFGMLNPEQEILFFFIIPMKLKYLALLDVILVFVMYARENLLLGVFALAGCAFSYWYVRRGSLAGYRSNRYEDREKVIRLHSRPGIGRRLNPLRWYSNYRDRKKFRDFLNKSGFGE